MNAVMDAVSASPKSHVIVLVKQMVLSEDQFHMFNEKIEKKLAERIPKAKENKLQSEMNRIYGLYRKAIKEHKINLKAQYILGQKLLRRIEKTEDLPKMPSILSVFQAKIRSLLEEHKKLEIQIEFYERSILLLLPKNTQFSC